MAQPMLTLPEGLLYEGHTLTPREALQAAQEHLEATMDPWAAHSAGEGASTVQAWWGGDQAGFVQAHHEGAQPVTVVNLPNLPTG